MLPYTMPRSMLRANLAIAYADQTRLTDATVQRTYDMMLASGVRSAIVARMEQMVLPDPVPLLRRLNMPTLLLWGDKDGMIPVFNAQEYLAALPIAALVVLPGIGHVPQEEAPQETIIPLLGFLAR